MCSCFGGRRPLVVDASSSVKAINASVTAHSCLEQYKFPVKGSIAVVAKWKRMCRGVSVPGGESGICERRTANGERSFRGHPSRMINGRRQSLGRATDKSRFCVSEILFRSTSPLIFFATNMHHLRRRKIKKKKFLIVRCCRFVDQTLWRCGEFQYNGTRHITLCTGATGFPFRNFVLIIRGP